MMCKPMYIKPWGGKAFKENLYESRGRKTRFAQNESCGYRYSFFLHRHYVLKGYKEYSKVKINNIRIY